MTRLDTTLIRLRGRDALQRSRRDILGLIASGVRTAGPSSTRSQRIAEVIEAARHSPEQSRMIAVLETFARHRDVAFFVQIGAHDGTQQDPLQAVIFRHQWPGILVEPVPYVFERLTLNYGHLPGVRLENLAVGPEDGTMPFYHLVDAEDAGRPGLPIWFDALGSLDRSVVMAHRQVIPDIAERLVERAVPVITFTTLLSRHGIDAVDVLLVDTEGYDAKILGSVDFDQVRPALIIYERMHLTGADQATLTQRLRSYGYLVHDYGQDTWCLSPGSLTSTERGPVIGAWTWATTDHTSEPWPATRALRRVGHALFRSSSPPAPPDSLFPLTDAEHRYLRNGFDDRTPLPAEGESLSPGNGRLIELKRAYAALDLPAVSHFMWSSDRVDQMVNLRYFRGDNLYQWHYPEHPRAMALTLFAFMRYLESRGGRELLDRLEEDGAFGAWTAEVPGYGKIGRDLLDSVNEILFLQRQLNLLGRADLRVLDIGAGYGRLAHRMSNLHPALADYCCVDAVPESTFLSEFYLGYRGCAPPARVVALDAVERTLIPGAFDLAVNVHSFSECTLTAITWWVEQVARLEIPHLFVVPNEYEGLISREVDGTNRDAIPVIEAAGYRLVATERVIDDPATREMTRINDNFMLFERSTGQLPALDEAGGSA